jgi:hypothetical protein
LSTDAWSLEERFLAPAYSRDHTPIHPWTLAAVRPLAASLTTSPLRSIECGCPIRAALACVMKAAMVAVGKLKEEIMNKLITASELVHLSETELRTTLMYLYQELQYIDESSERRVVLASIENVQRALQRKTLMVPKGPKGPKGPGF